MRATELITFEELEQITAEEFLEGLRQATTNLMPFQRQSKAMSDQEQEDPGFVFSIVEEKGDEVTIEVSEEDYQKSLAQGIDPEFLLKPGRHKGIRGGFLKRHPDFDPATAETHIHVSDEYCYRVNWSAEDECFIGLAEEFPGLSGLGATREEALREIKFVVAQSLAWIAEEGQEAPEPRSLRHDSGKLKRGDLDK